MYFLRRALPLVLLAAAGCESRMAMGEVNHIIVVAEEGLWQEVADSVLDALQPRIFAVRDEPAFTLTYAQPGHPQWGDLRRFQQILVIGRPEDPWVRPALEKADSVAEPPAIVEAPEVWARSQRVTAVLVPESGAAEAVLGELDGLARLLDRRYRVWATSRMYFSGHNRGLADTLRLEAGFSVDLPNVYRWRRVGDAAYMFLNDQPDASRLVRSLLVTWRSGTAPGPGSEQVVEWRDSVAREFYDWGQVSLRDRLEVLRLSGGGGTGAGALEVRGAWSGTLAGFPQGGPFITRIVDCPSQDRRYLLDAWLYAPRDEKYQYMIQLETLLGSFRCGRNGAGRA